MTSVLKAKIEKTDYRWSSNYGYVHDTAWALALGLNHSLHFLNDSGLEQFTNNQYYLDAIKRGMRDVHFAGISVSIPLKSSMIILKLNRFLFDSAHAILVLK